MNEFDFGGSSIALVDVGTSVVVGGRQGKPTILHR